MSQQIRGTQPRQNVHITLPDGLVLEGEINTTIEQFLRGAAAQDLFEFDSWLVAAICNGRIRELTYAIKHDSQVTPIYLDSVDGGRIYNRSLVLLLVTAVEELWSEARVKVNHAVTYGGFFCEIENRAPLTSTEIEQLEAHMHAIVAKDDPITKSTDDLNDIITYFDERGDKDKVQLLQFRQRKTLTMYSLRGRQDYYYGYMVPSTQYLKMFKLHHVSEGLILQYPRQDSPMHLDEIRLYNRMSAVFRQADDSLQKVGVDYVGKLNQLVKIDNLRETILVAEAMHEQNVANIAQMIYEQSVDRGVRIVLIAGPTSSGKTTFSKRLAIQLMAHGLRPFTLEMDNYFVDREQTPRHPNGEYDFEALEAVNLALFNDHLNKLMFGESVQMPKFDFVQGKSVPGQIAQLRENQIIIVEGIHGMNPGLVPHISPDRIFRVYGSVLTQVNIDKHNRVPTSDIRLMRRIVRDARRRGYSAADTIKMWKNVRKGEHRNIFPHQENANVMFNSALAYELAALRPLAEPLLNQVEVNTPQHIEANRLLSFLRWVVPMTDDQIATIPDTSLLREFVGGSILDDYHPGKSHDEL